jgi:hypothetical protein
MIQSMICMMTNECGMHVFQAYMPENGLITPFSPAITGVMKAITGVMKPITGVMKPITGVMKPISQVMKPIFREIFSVRNMMTNNSYVLIT